jgi:hypothetical protein
MCNFMTFRQFMFFCLCISSIICPGFKLLYILHRLPSSHYHHLAFLLFNYSTPNFSIPRFIISQLAPFWFIVQLFQLFLAYVIQWTWHCLKVKVNSHKKF